MATPEQVADVRRMADEPGTDTYTDLQLSALVDQEGSASAAAASIWQAKAARYSKLVDTSESGSSRKMSQLYSNALALSKHYANEANPVVPTESLAPFTVDIERV